MPLPPEAEPDKLVEVPMRDLAQAISCGLNYDHRFGYGAVPPALWAALNDYWRDRIGSEQAERVARTSVTVKDGTLTAVSD